VPSRGGRAWHELESAHFVLRTDLDPARAVETLELLEQLLHAYLVVGWNAKGWPKRLSIVILRNPDDVHHFLPRYDGVYVSQRPWPRLALSPWRYGPDGLSTVKHELTHHIAYAAIPNQPPWFAEGTASFFETAWFDNRGRFVIGAASENMAWRGTMHADELLTARANRHDPRF